MKTFVNEYQCTPDLVSESVAAWWGKKFRKGFIEMGICSLLIAILAILIREYVLLLFVLLPAAMMFLFQIVKNLAVKREQERIEVVYKDKVPSIHTEIDGDIHMKSDQTDRRISFSDVENIVETEHLIVLLIKGSMTVALDKNGFTSGTADECIQYLRERIK